MKKRVVFILTLLLIVACSAALFLSMGCSPEEGEVTGASSVSGSDGKITLTAVRNNNNVTVTVRLDKNCGINQMNLTLDYDTACMTLTGMEKGSALSKLDLKKTNVDTAAGYSFTPFKFDYLNASTNDSSTGVMFTLRFSVKKNPASKKTSVGFKYNKGAIRSLTNAGSVARTFAINPAVISLS